MDMRDRIYLKGILTGFVGLKFLDAITTHLCFQVCSNAVEVNPLAAWYVNANPSLVWVGVFLIGMWCLFIYKFVVRFPQSFNVRFFIIVYALLTVFASVVVANNVSLLRSYVHKG